MRRISILIKRDFSLLHFHYLGSLFSQLFRPSFNPSAEVVYCLDTYVNDLNKL